MVTIPTDSRGAGSGSRSGAELRERRRRRTASEIEHAALELFSVRGFDSVTVDDIANAAHISRRTFFRHYASKDDVLLGDPRRDEQLLVGWLDTVPSHVAPVDALHGALLDLASALEADSATTLLRIQVLDHAPKAMAAAFTQRQGYLDRLTPIIAGRMGVDENRDMRPALIVGTSISAMYVGIWHWLRNSADRPLHEVVTEALGATSAGLSAITAPRPTGRNSRLGGTPKR
jgi:AcrR family transcriptional regulator